MQLHAPDAIATVRLGITAVWLLLRCVGVGDTSGDGIVTPLAVRSLQRTTQSKRLAGRIGYRIGVG
jgi:hypothetical protein